MKVYETVVDSLEKLNVKYVFGIPGTHIYHVFKSIYENSNIKMIVSRHEENAVFMADLYGRISGEPGVSIVTAGPGGTNGATGLGQAFSVSSPLLYITGETTSYGYYEFHGLDAPLKMSEALNPLVKSSYILLDPDLSSWSIYTGYKIANSGRKGPVHISIPYDVISQETEAEKYIEDLKDRYILPNILRDKIQGKRILILIGPEGDYPEVKNLLEEVIVKNDIPYATFPCSTGFIPFIKGLYAGFIEKDYVIYPVLLHVLNEVDLVIGLGVRPESPEVEYIKERHPHINWIYLLPSMYTKQEFDKPVDELHIKTLEKDLIVAGDLKSLIEFLKDIEVKPVSIDINEEMKKRMSIVREHISRYQGERPLHQGLVSYMLYEIIPKDTLIILDTGSNELWMREFLSFKEGTRYIYAGSYGTIGFALGSAIGGYLSERYKHTISITGDGSLMMSLMELQTISEYDIPIKIIVINDGEYGAMSHFSRLEFGKELKFELGRINYARIAQEFGIESVRIEKYEDLTNIEDILENYNEPILVDIVSSAEHIPSLISIKS